MLGKIFAAKGDEVTGDCRRLHNGTLLDYYSLQFFVFKLWTQ